MTKKTVQDKFDESRGKLQQKLPLQLFIYGNDKNEYASVLWKTEKPIHLMNFSLKRSWIVDKFSATFLVDNRHVTLGEVYFKKYTDQELIQIDLWIAHFFPPEGFEISTYDLQMLKLHLENYTK